MRRVAISTISAYYLLSNVGSFLQHFALRKVLKALGYAPFRVIETQEHIPLGVRVREAVYDVMRPTYWWLKRLPNRRAAVVALRFRKRRERGFRRDFEHLIGRFDEAQPFDEETVGIRGGDQVLCPDSDYKWLERVKAGNPLITYAVSTDWFGNGNEPSWRRVVGDRLKRFTAVGIREQVGVEVVRELVPDQVPICHVLDSVMLLNQADYRAIQSPRAQFRKPTLFCYLVNIRETADLPLAQLKALAKALGCDLRFCGIQGAEQFIPKTLQTIYSPRTFLRALDDAAFFITNSYHGSALALLYRKSFLSIWQHDLPGRNQNQRQKELMFEFGLESRWMDYRADAEVWQARLLEPVDWTAVEAKLQSRRAFSLAWLKAALAPDGSAEECQC